MSAGQPFISDLSPCAFWDKVRGNDPFRNGPIEIGPDGFPVDQERLISISRDRLLEFLEYALNDWKSEYPGSINREDIEKLYLSKLI
jgi:hypothetical protein